MYNLVITALAVLLAVPAYAQFRSDSCNCPIPDGDPGAGSYGRSIPHFADIQPHRSPDGRYMSYVTPSGLSFVMDLSSHTSTEIIVELRHSGELQDYVYSPIWCPYDSDLVIVNVRSLVDTSGSGMSPVSAFNIFKYRISTRESSCITPDTLGRFGALSDGQLTFGASAWLAGSTAGRDSILVGMAAAVSPDHRQFWGQYVPQNQGLLRLSKTTPVQTVLASTVDSSHRVWVKRDPQTGVLLLPFYLDTFSLWFSTPLDTNMAGMQSASFSPDKKLVAYWAFPAGNGPPADTIFDQVWICPVSNPTKIEHVINFQYLYCTYSFWGIWPEFISDSTLAVSMHHDGDSVSALWEIGLDGHIVRQLTHVPTSVTAAKRPIQPQIAYPNPAHDDLTIELLKPGTVTFIDEMGRTVLTQSLPFGSSTVDISKLTAGAYTVRTPDGYTRVIIK